MEWFNEVFDLAAVASGAGLLGGAAGTGIALIFSSTIVKVIVRTLITAVMTGLGFLALLHYLGFEIIPPEELNLPSGARDLGGVFTPQAMPGEPVQQAEVELDERTYVIRSPFRRGGGEDDE